MSQAGSFSSGGGNITVPVTVPNGGTGQVSFPAHTVLLGEGTSAIGNAGPGAVGYVLTGQGAGADPIFSQIVAGSNMTITNTGNGVITFASTGGGGGGDITFNGDSGTATSNAGQVNIFGNSTQGVSTSGDAMETLTITVADASTTQKGVLELATNAETLLGASTILAVTPDDLNVKLGTQTQYGVAIGGGPTAALQYTGTGSAGQILQSGGNSANPTYSTATYPSTAGAVGNILVSDGTNFVSSASTFGALLIFESNNFNPNDSTIYYLNGSGWSVSNVAQGRHYMPRNGTITGLIGYMTSIAGSSENATLYIRVNDTTDYTVSNTLDFSLPFNNINASLSISLSQGDYFKIKFLSPAWVTNPTQASLNCTINII